MYLKFSIIKSILESESPLYVTNTLKEDVLEMKNQYHIPIMEGNYKNKFNESKAMLLTSSCPSLCI